MATAKTTSPCRARPAAPLLLATTVATALATADHGALAAQRAAQRATRVVNASGGVLIAEQACYDVDHYDLWLRVDPKTRTIRGQLGMRATTTDATWRVALDLDHHLQVDSVTALGREAAFEHTNGRIWIELPHPLATGQRLDVAVAYGGAPRIAPNPPWDGGFTWAETKDGRPWIATSCQGEGADVWWPCKDHPSDKPSSMDLHITVPDGLVCASNGTLAGERADRDGTRTFHWTVRNPISNYCVAVNIAPYEVLETEFQSVGGETVKVSFWALPESVDRARKVLPEFLDHLRFFEELCGPYPFRNEKYGIAETPHLGMEHQTIIAYGYRFQRPRFNYDWLHHHEASHEWWANLVTCRDWKDMWIHEGFGTYMQALYIERLRGRTAYHVEMETNRRRIANRKPVAPRETRDSKQIYFDQTTGFKDSDIYFKGSWIVHSLRWLCGDEVFFRALRRIAYPDPASERVTDGSQVRLVDTEDVRAIVEQVAERDLGWFFEVYLRQPELPELVVERRDGAVHLRWDTPGDLPFPMPVPVVVDGTERRVDMPDGRGHTAAPSSAHVAVDPNRLILRK